MHKTGVRMMALGFKLRDMRRPRRLIVAEAGIKPGDAVLDFGCGPGSYLKPTAELTGPAGRIYAMDISSTALDLARRATCHQCEPEFICGGDPQIFGDACLDVILLYDVLHHLENPQDVMTQFRRIIKPDGILSVSDHHLSHRRITELIAGPFRHTATGRYTLTFRPAG